MDAIDAMIDRLERIDGLTAYRDARMENAPDADYAVVRLTGETAGSWADGHLIDQTFGLSVSLYVKDERVDWLTQVQEALDELDLGYTLPTREYISSIDAVEWTWACTLYGPLEVGGDG